MESRAGISPILPGASFAVGASPHPTIYVRNCRMKANFPFPPLTLKNRYGIILCNTEKATERKSVTGGFAFQRAAVGCEAVKERPANSFRELLAEGALLGRLCRVRPLYRRGVLAPHKADPVRKRRSREVPRSLTAPVWSHLGRNGVFCLFGG